MRHLTILFVGLALHGCAMPMANEDALEPSVEVSSQALTEEKLLALGDSIAFGYDPFGEFDKDKNFVGYPDLLKGLYSVKNAGCPGETSGSLHSTDAADNGCQNYREAYPLHVNYGNSDTQLEYALARIADPEDRPTLITLNISGNDIFLLQAACLNDPRGYDVCFADGAPGLIAQVAGNVSTILGAIRYAGYTGDIVFMNLYMTDYSNPNSVGFVAALNSNVSYVASLYGAQIADAFGAFLAASGGDPCSAGLLIPLPGGGGCDVHPTLDGAQLLADSVLDAL